MKDISAPPQRFLDQVRQAAFAYFNRSDAAQRCVDWSRRFILFHNKRHPSTMGVVELTAFLQHEATCWAGVRIVDERKTPGKLT